MYLSIYLNHHNSFSGSAILHSSVYLGHEYRYVCGSNMTLVERDNYIDWQIDYVTFVNNHYNPALVYKRWGHKLSDAFFSPK